MNTRRTMAMVAAMAMIASGGTMPDQGRSGHRKTTPDKARQVKIKMRKKGRH